MVVFETLLQDLRYGVRMLLRDAGFSTVAALALALGIGVNTVAFTAYKAMVGRPLDARDPETMVNLALINHSGAADPFFSYPDYKTYRDQLRSFTGVIAHSPDHLVLSEAGGIVSQRSSVAGSLFGKLGLLPPGASNAEFASTFIVSENYFSVLGVAALRGRTFESMSVPELAASPSVLISENYWQKRFAGDPALLGKTIHLSGVPFTITGITPHDFVGASVFVPDFWLPLSLEPLVHVNANWLHDRENEPCRLFARLAPGVSMGQAQAEMSALAERLRTLHDPHAEPGKSVTALVWPGSPFPRRLDGGLKLTVLLIMLAVGMVLVVACANVASLQLARAASRQSELSMRLSLGASRSRIIRQLLTESALLGLLAGAMALPITWALTHVLSTQFAAAFPPDQGTLVFHVTPDSGILAYVFAISLSAGVLFGLAPALESSRSALFSALRANSGSSSVRSRRIRDFLITIQVAVSLVLMIAGSMLIRSAMRSLNTDTGYDGKHVVDLELQYPEGEIYTLDRRNALVRELRSRLAALPGVTDITGGRAPNEHGFATTVFAANTRATLYYTYVQANYFRTLGIPLFLGHTFPLQSGQPEHNVIISESAASRLWKGQNPIGRSLRLGDTGPSYQIIGVARDTRGFELDGSDSAHVYAPWPNDRIQDYPTLIRIQSDARQVMNGIAATVSSADPNLVATASTLDEMLHRSPSFVVATFAAAFASTVGLLGLLLASMGIYGTVSFIVVLRTREVGIRMAIGAQKHDVLVLILRESARPVLTGLLAGVFLAVGVSYLLRGLFYGVNPLDGVAFTGVSLLFLGVALIAAYLPSRRATRVDPMVALRYE